MKNENTSTRFRNKFNCKKCYTIAFAYLWVISGSSSYSSIVIKGDSCGKITGFT